MAIPTLIASPQEAMAPIPFINTLIEQCREQGIRVQPTKINSKITSTFASLKLSSLNHRSIDPSAIKNTISNMGLTLDSFRISVLPDGDNYVVTLTFPSKLVINTADRNDSKEIEISARPLS